MRALIFGRTGQVATELARQAEAAGVQAVILGRDQADLTDPAACAAAIHAADANVVINAAAWTAVDKAEAEEDVATLVNGASPVAMAEAAAAKGIPFLHVSTDYVFDGSGEAPWKPANPTGPLGAYGRSKLVGEQGVVVAGGAYAILRTSWVFSAHGANFVKTIRRLAETRDNLTVVGDQIGGPTPAADIAATLLIMARTLYEGRGKSGIYHYSGAPDVSWACFARETFAIGGQSVTVTDIPTAAYPTPAKRPGNSRMDCSDLLADYGIARPDWREGLRAVLADLSSPAL